jgi:hypothetical protein
MDQTLFLGLLQRLAAAAAEAKRLRLTRGLMVALAEVVMVMAEPLLHMQAVRAFLVKEMLVALVGLEQVNTPAEAEAVRGLLVQMAVARFQVMEALDFAQPLLALEFFMPAVAVLVVILYLTLASEAAEAAVTEGLAGLMEYLELQTPEAEAAVLEIAALHIAALAVLALLLFATHNSTQPQR